jgi:hypothetical protein
VVDTALVRRLQRREQQPGLVRLGQVRDLLARHRGMVPGVPLADALTRRVPERAVGPLDVPVVTGRPVAAPAAAAWTTPRADEPLLVVRAVVPAPAPVVPAPAPVVPAPVAPIPAVLTRNPAVLTRNVPAPAVSTPAVTVPPAPVRDLHTSRGTGPLVRPAVSPPADAVAFSDGRPVAVVPPAPPPEGPISSTPAAPVPPAGPSRPDASHGLAAALSEHVRSPARAVVVLPATRGPSLPVPPAPFRPAADLSQPRAAAPSAGPTDGPPIVTARRPHPRGVAPGEPAPTLPLVRPTPSAPPDGAPTTWSVERAPVGDRVVVHPGAREPGLAEQVHRLVVRELAGNLPPAAPTPPLPLPVPAAPVPHAAGPQVARRPAAPVVRADRPAERTPRAAPPVDVRRVADAVSRRLARRGAVDAERRGMSR